MIAKILNNNSLYLLYILMSVLVYYYYFKNLKYNLELPKCLNNKYGYDYGHTDCIC